jgi:predicted thioesterase
MRFRTKILQNGKTATGIEVPSTVVAGLGAGKRPAVKVTFKGYTYRSSIATVDGKYMVGVSAKVRDEAGVAGGDTVDVDVEIDTEKREVTVPPGLAKAFKRNAAARKAFEGLSNSRKQRLTLPIENAKTDATRTRNVEKALTMLRDGTA